TKKGVVKRVQGDAFANVRSNGLIAINLKDDDELLSVRMVEETDQVIIATARGQSIRFLVSDIRVMGRTAGGVKGISLKKDDVAIALSVVSKEESSNSEFLVLTQNGYGKKTPLNEYKIQ